MNKKTRKKLQELLIEISKITKAEKTFYDIRVEGDYISINNNYWEVPKRKQVCFHSFDAGQIWTDLE